MKLFNRCSLTNPFPLHDSIWGTYRRNHYTSSLLYYNSTASGSKTYKDRTHSVHQDGASIRPSALLSSSHAIALEIQALYEKLMGVSRVYTVGSQRSAVRSHLGEEIEYLLKLLRPVVTPLWWRSCGRGSSPWERLDPPHRWGSWCEHSKSVTGTEGSSPNPLHLEYFCRKNNDFAELLDTLGYFVNLFL